MRRDITSKIKKKDRTAWICCREDTYPFHQATLPAVWRTAPSATSWAATCCTVAEASLLLGPRPLHSRRYLLRLHCLVVTRLLSPLFYLCTLLYGESAGKDNIDLLIDDEGLTHKPNVTYTYIPNYLRVELQNSYSSSYPKYYTKWWCVSNSASSYSQLQTLEHNSSRLREWTLFWSISNYKLTDSYH